MISEVFYPNYQAGFSLHGPIFEISGQQQLVLFFDNPNVMVGYEFYLRDPIKGYQLVGVLPERRRNPKRITKGSVLNWGRKYFGKHLNLNEMFFIEVQINGETVRPL